MFKAYSFKDSQGLEGYLDGNGYGDGNGDGEGNGYDGGYADGYEHGSSSREGHNKNGYGTGKSAPELIRRQRG